MACRVVGTFMAIVALVGSATADASADDSLLKILPDRTMAFVVLNRLAATDAKLAEFSRRAQWPMPSLLDLFKSQAGVKEGLDDKGRAALVVVGDDQFDQPPVVLFVPVTDYDTFLAPLRRGEAKPGIARVEVWNSKFLAKRVGPYAVFAELRHESLLENGLTPGTLSDELTPLAAYLEENELSAVATSHGIFFAARIAEQHLRQMRMILGEGSAGPAKIFELYSRAINGVENEVACLAVGMRMEKEGLLRATGRASLKASGVAAAAITKFAPLKEDPLKGLPGGPFVVAGGAALPAPLVAALQEPYRDLVQATWGQAGLTGDQVDRFLQQSFALFHSARSQSVLLQPGQGEPAYRDALLELQVESASKFLDAYEKQMRAYAELLKPAAKKLGLGMPVAVDVRRTQINGLPALETTMQMPVAGAPQLQQTFEKLLGQGGKSTTWLAARDTHTVVMSYASKDLLIAALDTLAAPQKSLAADPLLAKTRALLPADALAVAYWSPRGTSLFANRLLKIFGDLLGGPKALPEFPSTPPLGLALRTAPVQLQAELVVPGEVTQSLMEYGMKLLAAVQLAH
jgi:hypothetical protein